LTKNLPAKVLKCAKSFSAKFQLLAVYLNEPVSVFPRKRESKLVVCFPPYNLRAPSLSMLTSVESDHQKTP
jgi:hypothetical protein